MLLTPEQKLKLYREIKDKPITGILRAIDMLETAVREKLEGEVKIIKEKIQPIKGDKGDPSKAEDVAVTLKSDPEFIEKTKGKDGDKGDKPVAGVDFKIPENGKNFEPTEADLQAIADRVQKAEIEKVIEKTVVVKEQPIIKEVAIAEEPKVLASKLNTLTEEVDMRVIRGLENKFLSLSTLIRSKVKGKKSPLHGGGDIVVAGSNVTITRLPSGKKEISSTGGGTGGLTSEIPTGSLVSRATGVGGTDFVVTVVPDWIEADNSVYREGKGYTRTGLNIVMDIPVSEYIEAFKFTGSVVSTAKSISFVLDAPTSSDVFPIFRVPASITITKIWATVLGGTSLTFNIEKRASASLNSSGTDLLASDLVADQTGASSTAFNGTENVNVATQSYLVLVASAISGTVGQVIVEIDYNLD